MASALMRSQQDRQRYGVLPRVIGGGLGAIDHRRRRRPVPETASLRVLNGSEPAVSDTVVSEDVASVTKAHLITTIEVHSAARLSAR